MANEFAVTAASNTILLNAQRQAETAFTVSNLSGRPIRGRARLAAQDQAAMAWLTLVGDAERDLPIAGTQPYTVRIAVPPAAAAGSYRFRLDVVGVDNPDEEFVEGPTVTFQVPEPPPVKPFPWWIIAVVAVVLVAVVAVVVFVVTRPGPATPVPTPTPTATAGPTTTPTPPPTFTPTPVPTRFGGGASGQVAFYSDRLSTPSLFVMPAQPGAAATPLATVPALWMSWSPDGARLLMTLISDGKLAVMNADGSDYTEVPRPSEANDALAAWSPDGRFIAFSRSTGSGGKHQIFVMNSDFSGLRQLTSDDRESYFGSWSPDGTHIAYMTDPAGGSQYDVWTMNAQDGSNRVNLTNSADIDFLPSWSPDGRYIVFLRIASGFAGNLWIMDPDGRNQHQVNSDTIILFSGFSWSPDSTWITYAEIDASNKSHLVAVHPDGTGKISLTQGGNAWSDLAPSWRP